MRPAPVGTGARPPSACDPRCGSAPGARCRTLGVKEVFATSRCARWDEAVTLRVPIASRSESKGKATYGEVRNHAFPRMEVLHRETSVSRWLAAFRTRAGKA